MYIHWLGSTIGAWCFIRKVDTLSEAMAFSFLNQHLSLLKHTWRNNTACYHDFYVALYTLKANKEKNWAV